MHEQIEVRVSRTPGEVEALRESWKGWPGHRDSDIDFYLMILAAYCEVLRPHVVVLYRDGRPDAILVGRLERKRLAFKVGYLSVFRPNVRCLTFVYGALHGNASSDNTRTLLGDVVKALGRDEADVAILEFVPIDSPLYSLSLTLPAIISRDAFPALQLHDTMIVPSTIDEVYRRMSAQRRQHLRRIGRRFVSTAGGDVRTVCYRSTADLDRLFVDAEQVAQKTYQRGLGAGFMDTPDVRMRLELAARKGWLRAYCLYVGDRPYAFWIGMLYNDSFVSEYLGYDPGLRHLSPGMVLIMRVIEGFCDRAHGDVVREVDFGLGHAEYKAALCTKNWVEATVHIFSPTLRGLIVKSMRTAARLADVAGRRILAHTSVFPRLKRVWRDHLGKKSAASSKNKTVTFEPIPTDSSASAPDRR